MLFNSISESYITILAWRDDTIINSSEFTSDSCFWVRLISFVLCTFVTLEISFKKLLRATAMNTSTEL